MNIKQIKISLRLLYSSCCISCYSPIFVIIHTLSSFTWWNVIRKENSFFHYVTKSFKLKHICYFSFLCLCVGWEFSSFFQMLLCRQMQIELPSCLHWLYARVCVSCIVFFLVCLQNHFWFRFNIYQNHRKCVCWYNFGFHLKWVYLQIQMNECI